MNQLGNCIMESLLLLGNALEGILTDRYRLASIHLKQRDIIGCIEICKKVELLISNHKFRF
jgi:hypothetical protein